MRKIKPTEGTVISGTLNAVDLLPALARAAGELDILQELDMGDSNLFECLAHPGNAWGLPGYGWADMDGYRFAECAVNDVESLLEALDNHAADYGMRFGAHENDGADFGFWMDDSDCRGCEGADSETEEGFCFPCQEDIDHGLRCSETGDLNEAGEDVYGN